MRRGVGQCEQVLRAARRQPAERQGLEVGLDRHPVEPDRRLDGLDGHRQQALLRRESDHHHVGEDSITEQPRGQRPGAQGGDVVRHYPFGDRGKEAGGGEVHRAVGLELAGWHDVLVGQHSGVRPGQRQDIGGRADDQVAGDDHVRLPGAEPRGGYCGGIRTDT